MLLRASLVLTIVAGLSSVARAQDFIPIDVPSATDTSAQGINSGGQIVGFYTDASYILHGFLDNGGIFTTIDVPGAPYTQGALGINNGGQIVGSYVDASNYSHGFLDNGGIFTTIDFPGAIYTQAWGINNGGQIVGIYYDGYAHGFLDNGGIFTTIDFPGAIGTWVQGINNGGQIVGSYEDASGYLHGFLDNGGVFTTIDFPGATFTEAEGINNVGQIVGTYSGPDVEQGFLDNGGIFTTIAFPGATSTEAWGINDYGQMVGEYDRVDDHGFLLILSPAAVKITDISMLDSHTLRVDVTAQFSRNPTTSKQITVSTDIEGVPLESILPLPSRDTGQQAKWLFIDLAANNVPQFADNQVFNVTATATEGQQQLGTDSKTGEIPLPVVHIHGILTDCFGDRIPHGLFQYLSSVHPSYVEDDGSPDGHGTNNQLTRPYPTLVSFDYQSLQMPVEFIGGDFTSWIEDELLPKTYASKVNVVAHSLGGIIARSAVVYSGLGPHVNKLILVGSPTEGAAAASFAIAHWGRIKAFLLLEQFLRPEVGLVFAHVMDCIVSGTQDTASQLLPSYPWWAPTLDGTYGYYPGYENPLLPALNAQPLDPSISYYAIVASDARALGITYTSEVFWRNQFLWFYDIVQDWTVALGPGDGIVPIRSQEALDVGWPRGVGPGKLDIFDDVGDVFHTEYFDQFQVQLDIETILWPSGQLPDEANIAGSSREILRPLRAGQRRVTRSTSVHPQNLGNLRPD